jgi:hypothetical protein
MIKEYSINLRELVEEHQESNSLAARPVEKPKNLNPTQIKMAEIKDNMRRFAQNWYTKEELEKAHPKLDHNAAINKVHEDILAMTVPSPEEVFKVPNEKT